MGILGIDTIAIVVSDRHKAIRWYRDVLGLDVAYIGPREANADPTVQGTADAAFVDPDGNVFDLKQPMPVEESGRPSAVAKPRANAQVRRAPRSPAGRGRGHGPRRKRPRRTGRAS